MESVRVERIKRRAKKLKMLRDARTEGPERIREGQDLINSMFRSGLHELHEVWCNYM